MLIQASLLLDPFKPPQLGWVRIENSKVEKIGFGDPPRSPASVDLGGGPEYLLTPGFIDAHTHLPQFNSIGFDGLPLLRWLDEVIFPAETAWRNPDDARKDARCAITTMLHAGTLGCAAYLTSHATGFDAVQNALAEIPMRAIVGRVIMDRNAPAELLLSPTKLSESDFLPENLDESDRFSLSANPRFAIACTDAALQFAGSIAGSHSNRFLQTHLAESADEVARCRELFPDDENYTAIYRRHNLLHKRTLLAHCNHLTESEWETLADHDAVPVHCPTANIFLQSGSFDFTTARKHDLRIALGSDIAAGPDIAMPCVARAMIETAKWRKMTINKNAYVPSPAEAWHIITRGNADLLGWHDAGRIEPNATADFLLLKPTVPIDDENYIARLIYNWSDNWISSVILNGLAIHPSASAQAVPPDESSLAE